MNGLISKVESTLAFYPEHDMEVKFDINVNNQDINIVNKLRYWVNKMISKTEDGIMALTQPKNLDDAQKGIRRNLDDLLKKERNYEEKESFPQDESTDGTCSVLGSDCRASCLIRRNSCTR